MQPHSIFDALQLAVSPVILISACGLLLLTMSNRLGRAIDRARLLARELNSKNKFQVQIIVKRARWIRAAILLSTVCIALTAVLVLLLFLALFLPFDVTLYVGVLFISSLLCLVASLIYFIVDIYGSLRAMEAELETINTAEL